MNLSRPFWPVALLATLFVSAPPCSAQDIKITRLRLQRVGDDAYFRVLIARPTIWRCPH